jgi:prepilin-type processing-associated H-X9-DG protein
MLLPALNKAREKAKAIHCINNLKQWGIGISIYADAFNDYLIPHDNMLSVVTGGMTDWNIYHSWIFNELVPDITYTKWNNCVSINACPVIVETRQQRYSYGISYLVSSRLTSATYHKITQVKNPSGCLNITDMKITAPGFPDYLVLDRVAFCHSNKSNWLYVDGHVRPKEIKLNFAKYDLLGITE